MTSVVLLRKSSNRKLREACRRYLVDNEPLNMVMKGGIMKRNDDNGFFSAFLTLFLIGAVILLFLYAVIIAHEKPVAVQ